MMYLLIIVFTAIASIAALFFKNASTADGLLGLIKNKNLYIGGFLYVLAALLNIYVLQFLDYSVVLPLSSMTYVWTIVYARVLHKEHINTRKFLGIALIVGGAALVAI